MRKEQKEKQKKEKKGISAGEINKKLAWTIYVCIFLSQNWIQLIVNYQTYKITHK